MGQVQPGARLSLLFCSFSHSRLRSQRSERVTQVASVSQTFDLLPPNAGMPEKLDESFYKRLQALGGGSCSLASRSMTKYPNALLNPPPTMHDSPDPQPTPPLPSHTVPSLPDRAFDENDPTQDPHNHPTPLRRTSTNKDSQSQVEDVNAIIQDQVSRLSVAFEHFVRNFTPV